MSLVDTQKQIFDKVTNIASTDNYTSLIVKDFLSVEDRIEIYKSGIILRLKNAIKDDFSVLFTLSEKINESFLTNFLLDKKSSTYTLNSFGAQFRDYVLEKLGYSSFEGQFADYEWKHIESYYLENSLGARHKYPQCVINPENQSTIRLSDTVFLFSSQYDLTTLYKMEHWSEPKKSCHIVWAFKGEVNYEEMSRQDYLFLTKLKETSHIDQLLSDLDGELSQEDFLHIFNSRLPVWIEQGVLLPNS